MNLTVDYRPQTFKDVIGHGNVKTFFKKAFKDKDNFTLPYSTMLLGNTGYGKSTIAKIVARTMNCHEPVLNEDKFYEPCHECKSCKDIEQEKYMRDVAFYSGATDNTNSIKSIQDNIAYMPTDKNKIIIIDEFQGLNEAAIKQLLNITEKPQKNIHFILITMDEKKTNKSINALKGRSQKFFLKQPSNDELLVGVLNILDKTDALDNVPETFFSETLPTVISNSDLGVRGILSDIERCLLSEIYDEKTVTRELGYISDSVLFSMLDKLVDKQNSVMKDLQDTDIKMFYEKSKYHLFGALQLKVFDAKEDMTDWKLKSSRRYAGSDNLQDLIKAYIETENATYYTDNVFMYNICEYMLKTVTASRQPTKTVEPLVTREPIKRGTMKR